MLEIEQQAIIAKNKGKEAWLQEFNPNPVTKEIILEILENEETENKN